MFYKCSDPQTSTRDWVALNVNSIPVSLVLTRAAIEAEEIEEIHPDNEPDEPSWNIEPGYDDSHASGIKLYEKPDPDAYEEDRGTREEYEEDLRTWEKHAKEVRAAWEAYEAREERGLEPMWSTFFHPEDAGIINVLQAACFESGFRLYDHKDLGLLLGVEGAGYSFYGAHWIPLRARLVASNEYNTPEDRIAILRVLDAEMRREGESSRELAKILGVELPTENGAAVAL